MRRRRHRLRSPSEGAVGTARKFAARHWIDRHVGALVDRVGEAELVIGDPAAAAEVGPELDVLPSALLFSGAPAGVELPRADLDLDLDGDWSLVLVLKKDAGDMSILEIAGPLGLGPPRVQVVSQAGSIIARLHDGLTQTELAITPADDLDRLVVGLARSASADSAMLCSRSADEVLCTPASGVGLGALETDQPLRIGQGPLAHFAGRLDHVSAYQVAGDMAAFGRLAGRALLRLVRTDPYFVTRTYDRRARG